ncbi:hypothetical protein [Azohydromonas australica]|uniref:hypothetical protein n=1 Tax=Azohydromonas australica TaxID=364039 RepID=UPI0012EC42F0|nr:hypothetical protein [Azohydromonas australica]
MSSTNRCGLLQLWKIALSLALFSSQYGMAVEPKDPVLSRGLQHSKVGRSVLEGAVASSNLLTHGHGPRLRVSWAKADGDAAPVYLVESRPGALSTPAAVPVNCWCVFVNLPALNVWLSVHSAAGLQKPEPMYILSFMLMHEVGHLMKRTAGAEFTNGSLFQLNIEPSLAKAREEEADQFAAELVRYWARETRGRNYNEAELIAGELLSLSQHLANRTVGDFWTYALGSPEAYFDQNLSHPNLAWRIFRSTHLIWQSGYTKHLLKSFEEARQRGVKDPFRLPWCHDDPSSASCENWRRTRRNLERAQMGGNMPAPASRPPK